MKIQRPARQWFSTGLLVVSGDEQAHALEHHGIEACCFAPSPPAQSIFLSEGVVVLLTIVIINEDAAAIKEDLLKLRKEHPRRVMDFTFLLSGLPLLGLVIGSTL